MGVGVDAVELVRMRAALDRTPRLATRTFTDDERAYCVAKRDPTERFAARFAAKEAVLKVLGESILRLPLRDIEVVRARTGKPSLRLHGAAAERAAALGITSWQVSLTHTHVTATAVVIGVADGPGGPGEPDGAASYGQATGETAAGETAAGETAAGETAADDEHAWYALLDRKRNAAAALLFDGDGRLLVVRPTYEPGWTLPGGAVDAGESPRQACEREILEEIGLRRRVGRLLTVEWRRSKPVKGEAILWVFDGGTLTAGEIAAIVLPAEELADHAFVPAAEALARIAEGSRAKAGRVRAALDARERGHVAWLDDGVLVDHGPGPGPGPAPGPG